MLCVIFGKKTKKTKKPKKSWNVPQVLEAGAVQVGALRGQGCANESAQEENEDRKLYVCVDNENMKYTFQDEHSVDGDVPRVEKAGIVGGTLRRRFLAKWSRARRGSSARVGYLPFPLIQ